MKKGILFATVFWMVTAAAAWADVTGSWDISAQVKVKVAIKGVGSDTVTETATDHFVFHTGGSFDMIDFEGTWAYSGKKVFVNLDATELEEYFELYLEEGLANERIDADVQTMNISANTFSCKESKTGTMAGSWKLVLRAYIWVPAASRGFDVNVNSKTTFTGVRASGAQASEDRSLESDSQPVEGSGTRLMEMIGRQIGNALSGAGLAGSR